MLAAQSLQLGDRDVMIAGGMESMSNVPFYVHRGLRTHTWHLINQLEYGHQTMQDGIIKDGLWDVYNNFHMGNCAEKTAAEYKITRQDQDEHAISSYKRAAEAWARNAFKDEIVGVPIQDKKGEKIILEDEEYKNVNFDKLRTLKSVFQKDGTVTAANSSTLNDGAAALVLMTQKKAEQLGFICTHITS
jgi:acetyl-CoA C-acetyltransferase